MQVEWELDYHNLTLYKISAETEYFQSGYDTFGTKLMFSVTVEPSFQLDYRDLISIGGEIAWQTDNINAPSSLVIPDQPLHFGRQLVIPMSNQLIRQIEQARNGGEVALQISLHGLCFVPGNQELNVDNTTRGLVDPQFKWLRGRTTSIRSRHSMVPIHREKWADLLNGMNFSSYRMVELPALSLTNRQTKRWETVIELYEKMLLKQRVGNFEECIEVSRLVVDELISVLGGHFKLNMGDPKKSGDFVDTFQKKMLGILPNDQQDHFKSFINLLFSITNFSSLYHHSANRPTLLGNLREQAEHMAMLCTAAVSAGSKMLCWVPHLQGHSS